MDEPTTGAPDTDDAAVVREVLDGDTTKFRVLVERYQERVYGLAARILRDPDQARDVSQEAFLRAYRSLGTYDAAYPFRSWMFKIAHHCALAWLRRKGVHAEVPDAGDSRFSPLARASVASAETDVDDRAERKSLVRLLEDFLEALTPASRAVMLLRHREDMPLAEVARALELPVGTVKSRLNYAYRQLRDMMESKGRGPS